MSEKESPESSSSGSPGLSTPSSKNSAGDANLVVKKQPPLHLFNEEWFDIEFGLDLAVAPSSPQRTGDTDCEFLATLHHGRTGQRVGSDVEFSVDPQRVWFSLRGSPSRRKQRVRCRIRVDEIRKDKGESFCVRLSPKDAEKSSLRGLVPATTNAVTLVNHKIKVEPDSDWEQVWYKDEGGRDKCMTIFASLVDRHNKIHRGEEIPLQMTLYYANEGRPLKVTKQEILKALGVAQRQHTEKKTGRASLRFRIDDVSKNHQGQDFRVEVAPDTRIKGFKDVAPGFSPPVSIRSKRNKRQRSGMSSGGRQDQRLSSPRMFADDAPRSDTGFATADMTRVRDAVKGVMHWADEVVNGLSVLPWQVIGYNPNPDGSPDYNRPLHNMPNPNVCISHILRMYSESTRENLNILNAAVERQQPGSQDPYMPHAASPREEEGFDMPPHRGHPVQNMPYQPRHPHSTPDAYQNKPPEMLGYAPPHGLPMRPTHPGMHHHHPLHRQPMVPRTDDMGQMPIHMAHPHPMRPETTPHVARDHRESEVAYVLGTQYKAFRNRERLGFPAYAANKELLGFYRDKTESGQYQFVPIDRYRDDFGPLELMQATEVLDNAMTNKSENVYSLKDWGSISNLLDNALVFAWSANEGSSGSNG